MTTYEKVISIALAVMLIFTVVSNTSRTADNREYLERIDTELSNYNNLNERTVGELQATRGRIETIENGVISVEDRLGTIEGLVRPSIDNAVGVGIISDRNVRLVEELRRRLEEGEE